MTKGLKITILFKTSIYKTIEGFLIYVILKKFILARHHTHIRMAIPSLTSNMMQIIHFYLLTGLNKGQL